MHELSIARSVIRETEKRLRGAGVDPLSARAIRVSVGDISGADAGALEECLGAVLPTSGLSNATAEVRRVPAEMVCASCGRLPAPSPFRLACPRCGGRPERVEGAGDVTVEEVEVESSEREGQQEKERAGRG